MLYGCAYVLAWSQTIWPLYIKTLIVPLFIIQSWLVRIVPRINHSSSHCNIPLSLDTASSSHVLISHAFSFLDLSVPNKLMGWLYVNNIIVICKQNKSWHCLIEKHGQLNCANNMSWALSWGEIILVLKSNCQHLSSDYRTNCFLANSRSVVIVTAWCFW